MIDFKAEVLKIKDQMIDDIKMLCAIPSTQDDSTVAEFAPYGAANRRALDAMLEIGRRDGFEVQDVDGHAGHIDIGTGDETFGILGHLDVVPVNKVGRIVIHLKLLLKKESFTDVESQMIKVH